MKKHLFILLSIICFPVFHLNAAQLLKMKGKVYDGHTQEALENVSIFNVTRQETFLTDSTGLFQLQVKQGDLIEFQKMGYRIARVRITNAQELPYYSIGMTLGPLELEEVFVKGKNYRVDSIIDRETYKWALDHYQLEGINVIQHPFDALSKRNRQIWAFQKHFQFFEREKYVDFVFNDIIIKKLTEVDSAHLEDFKRAYRPTYDQIQSWNEYEFFEYIKMAGEDYIMQKRRR